MFDKTFPTLDCAACILTPKMVEVGQHPYINLLTYSEIKGVEGGPGNYKVKILKKARRVDSSKCIGCGTCSEKCPGKAFSEFDAGTTLRKAIYIPFPQAVPNKYLIDEENCRYVQGKKCGVCVKVCPVPDCINLDAKDELVEITVGNIIVATGFKTFDPKRAEQFGYGKFPNVITSLEFERLINAAGPTGGNITFRTKDKKGNWIFTTGADVPDSVAIIHCIGSRDENYNAYCSKVCCMYSLKLAHLVKEKLPDAEVYEHYIDMRAFGKGYEEFYERIKNEGINIIRGRTASVDSANGELVIRSEDVENDRLIEQKVEMVILAVGLEPTVDARELARMLRIKTDKYGWMREIHQISNPVDTPAGGIAIAGLCQGPKDIPDTVAQASAAASRVLQSILNKKVSKGRSSMSLSKIEKRAKELSLIKDI
jgi:heterodisulfide reductase subunit A